jgi:hypothetical protein
MKFPGVISFRNDLPTCAIPNGGFRRAIWATFLKLMKIPCAVSGRRYASVPVSSTAPTRVRNIRLKLRGSVRSQSGVSPGRFDGRLPQRTSSCSGSARWSARNRCLQVRQSTSGSLNPPTCPDASQTFGWRMIDESSATMSSRSRTIASSQRALTFSLSRTP